MKPILSLILPVYKVEAYVGACLDSILTALEQVESDESFEVICVDDGSPDRCGKILESYRERFAALARADRVSYMVIHQKNAGVSAARNAGLEAATGEWLWFIDSDDSIAPFALAYLARALREHPADVFRFEKQDVASQGASFQFGGGAVKNYDLTKDSDVHAAIGRGSWRCFLWHACYRRALVGDLRFLNGLQPGEDDIFGLQMVIRSSTLAVTDTRLYNYVLRADSCMRAMDLKKLNCLLARSQILRDNIRSWKYGSAALPFFLKNERGGLRPILKMILRLPSQEQRQILPLYYRTGVLLFEGSPLRQLLFRTHCPQLILLYLSVSFWIRVTLLKLRVVRQLRDWVRSRRG